MRTFGFAGDIRIDASDVSPDALALAVENAVAHGVADLTEFRVADLLGREASDRHGCEGAGDDMRYDLVLANLPYIPTAVVPRLPVAASFEPRLALDGGPDGLDVIRRLLGQLPDALSDEGVAMLEIGSDQAELVREAVTTRLPGRSIEVRKDLAGRSRLAVLTRPRR